MPLSPKQNEYSVYIHTNKINGKKYIGITKQKPERRWQNGHGYENTYFGNAIKKYGWDNFTHEVILSQLPKDIACNIECALIAQFKTTNRVYGYNISEGGETCDANKGRTGLDHPNHKRVKMIDPVSMNVLCIYNSQTDAAKIMGINRKGITKACQGILKTYKGYIWEYADIDYKKPKHNGVGNYEHTKLQKPIYMIDTDGTIYRFESVKQAAEITGINKNNISRYLTGIRKDTTKRGWYYES